MSSAECGGGSRGSAVHAGASLANGCGVREARASALALGPAGSGAKIHKTVSFQGRTQLVKDSYGAEGMLADHDGHVEFMTGPSMSIRGGTDEIQRNVIGERVLGLPGEPRPDKTLPFKDTAKNA